MINTSRRILEAMHMSKKAGDSQSNSQENSLESSQESNPKLAQGAESYALIQDVVVKASNTTKEIAIDCGHDKPGSLGPSFLGG